MFTKLQGSTTASRRETVAPSLSMNYAPRKLSNPILTSLLYWLNTCTEKVLKMGGGVNAFWSSETIIVGPANEEDNDDDDDSESGGGTDVALLGRNHTPRMLSWSRLNEYFSTTASSNLTTFTPLAFYIWPHADITRTSTYPELMLAFGMMPLHLAGLMCANQGVLPKCSQRLL
ncbi:hypothetical protein GALMADRAFT_883444 [Galerina marginata CBS 339.88]|uniref:Uncharacterized protein n=1 Tax=Galerina marginata (strain CBS 339.88) TaxID=685588 RepID=A0A067SRM3_GALM3|nr:hypothetical protein GALMADRAFT_883444 [Galerina marginata CBS 339.88]